MERLATETIPSAECRQGIQTRRDLAVAGKLLQPYHRSCINSPVSKLGRLHRFYGTFPLGGRFWLWLLVGNVFLTMVASREFVYSWTVVPFWIAFNLVFVTARVGVYLSYERHLEE